MLLSSGEQVSCSLIAGRLIHNGFKARSWLAWQIPIFTNGPKILELIKFTKKNY